MGDEYKHFVTCHGWSGNHERDRDHSQARDKDCSEMLHSSKPKSKRPFQTADPNRRLCKNTLALNEKQPCSLKLTPEGILRCYRWRGTEFHM